ncbi:MAG: Ig-like domain repeat protein [Candidatus Cloacimonetes bacterium]|nr:Ig-like domain repeat protein [Candidatus Cloacimonadota bacterium]
MIQKNILKNILSIFLLTFFCATQNHATIDSIALALSPADLKITGGFVDTTFTVTQSNNPQQMELTFVREGPAGCDFNQSLVSLPANNLPTSGTHVVVLCSGDRVVNKIFVIGKEVTSAGLTFGTPTLEIISDTIGPDKPNLDETNIAFPATVYTPTFQITGNVDNSAAGGTDKPETAGSVTIFFPSNDPDNPETIIGGGLIQPNSNFIATIDLSGFLFGDANAQTISIFATDPLGHRGPTETLGVVTRGQGGDVALQDLSLVPPNGSLTGHSGVMIQGTVTGTVAPFTVKFFMDDFLNSEVSSLKTGDKFSHTLNMSEEGTHCFSAQAVNSNTPIFAGPVVAIGCIELDLTAPNAPIIITPSPTSGTLLTKGPSITIDGITEPDKNSENILKPKLHYIGPSGVTFTPSSPLEIDAGTGRFNIEADIQSLPDGQHIIELRAEDEVGNSSETSLSRITFIKDSLAPIVEEVRLNNVVVPQLNPPIFIPSTSVRLQIRLNEPSTSAPNLFVKPSGGSEFAAGLFGGAGVAWEYSFAISKDQDGPLSIRLSEGADLAGNKISFALADIVVVDTKAPNARETIPKALSVFSKTPELIRVIFEDPPLNPGNKSSGVDLFESIVTLKDPDGTAVKITQVQFDPVTLDVIPQEPFEKEGSYQLEVQVKDNANNLSPKQSFLYTFDTTAIGDDRVTCNPVNDGFIKFGTEPFVEGADHFVDVTVDHEQFDVNASSLIVKNIREIPQILVGDKSVISPNTMRYTLDKALPNDNSKDGRYSIESQIFDLAGNQNKDSICVFTYDNCPPTVESVFPAKGQVVSKNLSQVSAMLKDCLPRFDVEISDIDLQKSVIKLFKDEDGNKIEISSRLRFETIPEERVSKILLEIVDGTGATTTLPNDGSADGQYEIQVEAFDKAGNSSGVTSSAFQLDTLEPVLIAENLENNMILSGGKYYLYGKARDIGSEMDRVEIKVESYNGTIPVSTLLDFTPTFLESSPLQPQAQNPAFRGFSYMLNLTVRQETRALVTFRAYDKAGNHRDYSFDVTFLATDLNVPSISQPTNKYSTNAHFINFSWLPVDNAVSYEIEVTTPNQNRKTFNSTTTNIEVNLASLGESEGTYLWNVKALDSFGNKGISTLNYSFTIDHTNPKVSSITIQDPSPESQGRITQGVTNFLIQFSEEMDPNNLPEVFIQSIDFPSLSPVEVPILNFSANTLIVKLDLNDQAISSDLHGFVKLNIVGGYDLAHNPLALINSGLNLFEIQKGPFFHVKFFVNPIDQYALTFAIKGFTKEAGGQTLDIPALPSVVVLRNNSQEIALTPVRLTASAFVASFHLSQVSYGSFSLKVSGIDEYGNNSVRIIPMPISVIHASKLSVVSNSKMRVAIDQNSINNDAQILLPSEEFINFPKESELEYVEELPSFVQNINLAQDSTIQGLSKAPRKNETDPVDLYIYHNGKWNYTSVKESKTSSSWVAQSSYLGPMAFFRDQKAPLIDGMQKLNQNSIEFHVKDDGSGVDVSKSYLLVDNQKVKADYSPSDSVMKFSLSQINQSQQEAQLHAFDRSGNMSISKAVALASAKPSFEPQLFPNPVKNELSFRLYTNFAPQSAEMYIYDVSSQKVYSENLDVSMYKDTYRWDLSNSRGHVVKNGVYFLKIKLTYNNQIYKKTLKFAVLN